MYASSETVGSVPPGGASPPKPASVRKRSRAAGAPFGELAKVVNSGKRLYGTRECLEPRRQLRGSIAQLARHVAMQVSILMSENDAMAAKRVFREIVKAGDRRRSLLL